MCSDFHFRLAQVKYKNSLKGLFGRLKVANYIRLQKAFSFSLKKETNFFNLLLVFLLSRALTLKIKAFASDFKYVSTNLDFYISNKNIFNYCYKYLTNLFFLPILESFSYRLSFGFRPYRNCFDFVSFIKKELLRIKFDSSFVLTCVISHIILKKEKLQNFFINKNLGNFALDFIFYDLKNLKFSGFLLSSNVPFIITSIINFFALELFILNPLN